MAHERANAANLERARAAQSRSPAERIARRRAYLEHHEATLSDDERRQLEALRDDA